MSYRFEPDEPVSRGVKRIAVEQVDQALEGLDDMENDPDEAIHDARKRFKKVRAVLRLVRPHVGEDVYASENVEYRDAGRLLAEVRESNVAVETVAGLREAFGELLEEDAFSVLEERLVERHEAILAEATAPGGPAQETAERIRAARSRIAGWPVEDVGFDALGPGVRKVYKRGRNRLHDAYADPGAERFHEWRKRVKYLWYHMRILRPAWRGLLEPLAEEIHDLADHLGDGNDLTDLLALLEEHPGLVGDVPAREALQALAVRERRTLWERSRPLGLRIYAEEPDAFVARIEAYWHALRGQDDDRLEAPPDTPEAIEAGAE